MEDILYCKDLYEPIERDTAKPKDMDDEKWKRLHRKTIGHIRQWLDDSVFSHVSNETDAQVLWKKLEARYEQKTATNKAFLIRKLVNMKFKEGGSIADHLNEFQSVVNQLATMKMVIEDELQALLLLSSLPDIWETLVVTMSNSAPDGKLSMGQVSSSLFNEETRRKLVGTDNAQALVSENRGRSKNRGHKGHGKSKGRSQSRGKSTEKGKCYHCGKEGHLKRNCYAWKREQKEENNNQKKNEEKNTTATFEGDEVVVLSCGEEECLHVGNEIEWVVDTGASYHATYNKEFFTSYKAGDFGTVKMGNTSHSKIVGIGDVCIRTSVGCMMTLRDVRHVPDLRLNLISGIALDREGYMNYFGNGVWKLTKGSLVVARGKACCTLYKTNLKKNLISVSDCKMYWQSNGDYLTVKVDRYTKTKKSTYTGFELFRIKEQDIPIEVLELENKNDKIIAFAWEPKGHRFVVIHGDSPRPDISFYSMRSTNNMGRVSKLATLKGKQANALCWSPAGRFIILAGLKGFNGQLEFFNVDELETMATAEHFMATDIEWDPTGRYVATSVTSVHEMENGFNTWSFNGKLLYRILKDHFFQFLWRPRSPSFLSPEKEEDIAKNLKKYIKKYEAEDQDVSMLLSEQDREKRKMLKDVWERRVS
ncbi:hypothetical protein F0562_010314 [Nyssa sinensis]|uniref:CCHC-type domain-containing protein n=1 Tax=Nyssa sinensis TaxID=561372 RepID=A0A5J5A3A3_9ASTE|nr:hypothetical protein F0562_010314 [Nyssa sinensis]